ncbi:GntR family transcriptional regulator [Frigidibacter sp. ROC022]|uniref:GntR family transcriptional regulator n=1 Tax=Frigidibacter sp. ROC022 TaxID=2971796 RepID=UPI00215B5908|nr:GntR family transcriptional regulator [Frigidibacter sp. ROC022]MCR8725791.1 GntR family transcriptional regulator [Frigidibacter sp. ROC022]
MPGKPSKYRLIADHLMEEIRKGRHPVGGLLPTESELMQAYGVSRHTVRMAVQELRSRGAVASRQGQGSTVVSTSGHGRLTETISSIEDLVAFGQDTRREFLSSRIVTVDEALAARLGCRIGRRLVEVLMLRKAADTGDRPVALVTLWLDIVLEPAVEDLGQVQKSAAEVIENRFGLKVETVAQTIEAALLTADQARDLGAEPGDPALVVRRDYATAPDADPFLIAHSICRADAFKVQSRFSYQA